MTEVLQCPYCDLRFSTRSELEQHKALDHPQPVEDEKPEPAAPETTQPEEIAEKPQPSQEKRGFLSRWFKGK